MAAPTATIGTKAAYGVGSVSFGVKDNGYNYLLLLFYNQAVGLPAQWVGFAIMLALIVDAFVDPAIGYASDNLRSRWGRRHPFMYAAALPTAILYFLLWNPPGGLTPPQTFAWLLGVAIAVRIAIACYEIPSASLAAELTDDYDQRTSFLTYRYFFGWTGGIVMGVASFSVFLRPEGDVPGVLNRAGYSAYGAVAALVMLVAILVSAIGTHRFIPHLKAPPPRRRLTPLVALREIGRSLSNRSFLASLFAGMFSNAAVGISAALTFYLYSYFWELTPDQTSLMIAAAFLSTVIATASAPRISKALGKKRGAMLVAGIALVLTPLAVGLRLLGLMPPNGTEALFFALFAIITVAVAFHIMSHILVASMVTDTVEDNELTTGHRTEGLYFAANFFVQKCVSGLGVFGSSLLLAAIDFPEGAKPGEVADDTLRALALTYLPTICALYLIALLCLSAYRINREAHLANLAKLGREPVEPAALT